MAAVQETRFEYKGFPCVVLFQSMGHRCGYVGLPKENKYYGKNYNDIPVSCHGGLTYVRNVLILQDDTDIWWIGFDCAHCFDARDYDKAREYFSADDKVMDSLLYMEKMDERFTNRGEVRTLKYCIEECKSIVDQIVGDA